MAKKAANGTGSIRQRPDGRWEARYIVGINPGTGAYIRKSVYGKTQREVRQKLTQAAAELDSGTYLEPVKMTVGKWLDTWEREYLQDVSPSTRQTYKNQIRLHIKPAFGAVQLEALSAPMVQQFYNRLAETKAPKTIKLIHSILHKALDKAVSLGYIRTNPTEGSSRPKVIQKQVHPLDDDAAGSFLAAIRGHRFQTLYTVALFTGMREGELLGLLWDSVDFAAGTIHICTQLQKGQLTPPKGGKSRTITPAPHVMELLKQHRATQAAAQLRAGEFWEDTGLVFTNERGGSLFRQTVCKEYKRIMASIGRPEARFHDLRHSYAVAAIRSGDDIKTIQENLGHASATITLDIYAHVTEQMKQDSAARMEQYIKRVSTQ